MTTVPSWCAARRVSHPGAADGLREPTNNSLKIRNLDHVARSASRPPRVCVLSKQPCGQQNPAPYYMTGVSERDPAGSGWPVRTPDNHLFVCLPPVWSVVEAPRGAASWLPVRDRVIVFHFAPGRGESCP